MSSTRKLFCLNDAEVIQLNMCRHWEQQECLYSLANVTSWSGQIPCKSPSGTWGCVDAHTNWSNSSKNIPGSEGSRAMREAQSHAWGRLMNANTRPAHSRRFNSHWRKELKAVLLPVSILFDLKNKTKHETRLSFQAEKSVSIRHGKYHSRPFPLFEIHRMTAQLSASPQEGLLSPARVSLERHLQK